MAIWQEEKGTPISREEAADEAVNLLTLYNAVYRPVKSDWLEHYLATHPDEYEKRKENHSV